MRAYSIAVKPIKSQTFKSFQGPKMVVTMKMAIPQCSLIALTDRPFHCSSPPLSVGKRLQFQKADDGE